MKNDDRLHSSNIKYLNLSFENKDFAKLLSGRYKLVKKNDTYKIN